VRDVLAKDAITVLPADQGNGSDHDTITNLLRILREQPLPSPFFLWVPLEGPHARGDVSRRVAYVPYPKLRGEYARTYDEAVRRTDTEFGRLVAGLRELGLYDDTLIVVMADHGEALGEHADLFHAKEVYQTSTHVPLIFRMPGGAHAGNREVVAELVDVVPTIAAIAGLAPANGHPGSGKSLLPWITGERTPAVPEEAFTEAVFMRRKVVGYVRREADGRLWKAVHDHTNDVTEVYDLAADPHEARNLADAQPERAAEMRERVRAHLAAEGAPQFVPITQP
jgi:arylsulfatase A-like enzyme